MSDKCFRKGIDSGLEDVKKWIEQWYGDISNLSINSLQIMCPSKEEMKSLYNDEKFTSAFRKNETPLHSYLKFIARLWLENNVPERRFIKFNKIQYETKMYFPDNEYIDKLKLNVVGSDFDIRTPQVIENNLKNVTVSFGDMIIVDVFGRRVSVEVGYTQPCNLCMPFLKCLANKSIWLPFPNNLNENKFDVNNVKFKYFTAYEIFVTDN